MAFWEEVRDALLEAQRERAAFVAVVRTGRALTEALDRYEMAHDGDMKRMAELAVASEAAEDAFVEALNRVPGDLGPEEVQPWGEEAFLVALDQLSDESEDEADEDGGGREPRH